MPTAADAPPQTGQGLPPSRLQAYSFGSGGDHRGHVSAGLPLEPLLLPGPARPRRRRRLSGHPAPREPQGLPLLCAQHRPTARPQPRKAAAPVPPMVLPPSAAAAPLAPAALAGAPRPAEARPPPAPSPLASVPSLETPLQCRAPPDSFHDGRQSPCYLDTPNIAGGRAAAASQSADSPRRHPTFSQSADSPRRHPTFSLASHSEAAPAGQSVRSADSPRSRRLGPRCSTAVSEGTSPARTLQSESPCIPPLGCANLDAGLCNDPDPLRWLPLGEVRCGLDWRADAGQCLRLKQVTRSYAADFAAARKHSSLATAAEIVLRQAIAATAALGRPNPALCCVCCMLLKELEPLCRSRTAAAGTAIDEVIRSVFLSAYELRRMLDSAARPTTRHKALPRAASWKQERAEVDPRQLGLREQYRTQQLTHLADLQRAAVLYEHSGATDLIHDYARRTACFEQYMRTEWHFRDFAQRAGVAMESIAKRSQALHSGVEHWQNSLRFVYFTAWRRHVRVQRIMVGALQARAATAGERTSLRRHFTAWRVEAHHAHAVRRRSAAKERLKALLKEGLDRDALMARTSEMIEQLKERVGRALDELAESEQHTAEGEGSLQNLIGEDRGWRQVAGRLLATARKLPAVALEAETDIDAGREATEGVLQLWANAATAHRFSDPARGFSADWKDGRRLLGLLSDLCGLPQCSKEVRKLALEPPAATAAERMEQVAQMLCGLGIEVAPQLLLDGASDEIAAVLYNLWHRFGHVPLASIAQRGAQASNLRQDVLSEADATISRVLGKDRATEVLGLSQLGATMTSSIADFSCSMGASFGGRGLAGNASVSNNLLDPAQLTPRTAPQLAAPSPLSVAPLTSSRQGSRPGSASGYDYPGSPKSRGEHSPRRRSNKSGFGVASAHFGSGRLGRTAEVRTEATRTEVEDETGHKAENVRNWLQQREALHEHVVHVMLRRCRGIPTQVMTVREASAAARAAGDFCRFSRSKLVPHALPDADLPQLEMDSLILLFTRYFQELSRVFSLYSAKGRMDLNSYFRFLNDCKLLGGTFRKPQASRLWAKINHINRSRAPACAEDMPTVVVEGKGGNADSTKPVAAETCWFTTLGTKSADGAVQAQVASFSADEIVNTDDKFVAAEFSQLLVHLAAGRLTKTRKRITAAVEHLLTHNILPNAGAARALLPQQALWSDQVQEVMARARQALEWLFRLYAAKDAQPPRGGGKRPPGKAPGFSTGADPNTVSLDEWMMCLADCELFVNGFKQSDGKNVFRQAQLEEEGSSDVMVFSEFADAIGCVGLYLIPNVLIPPATRVLRFMQLYMLPAVQRLQERLEPELAAGVQNRMLSRKQQRKGAREARPPDFNPEIFGEVHRGVPDSPRRLRSSVSSARRSSRKGSPPGSPRGRRSTGKLV
eukprot:TRINITY_DN1104_c0_g1_i2.p1 TRINITY_DN1104_c0_g1~~TRINITY_DN1104_c0_g1_i2.p1  ORF type:complete len:1408 (+),score=363.56 TRINITY_DN1104_c0_g1_i2:100-4323(+)